MTDAANTVGTPCLGVWADPRAIYECKSSASELVTVGEMKPVMESLVTKRVNKMFGYGLTKDEVSSTSYPDVDMETDLRTLENFTTIVHPNAAARERLRALPSMTEMSASKQELQNHLDAEKQKVLIASETARRLRRMLDEPSPVAPQTNNNDSILDMLRALASKLETVEALREQDAENAKALRKQDIENAKALRKQDAENAKALRKKDRVDAEKRAEVQIRKLEMDIKELENEIKHLKQDASEREDQRKRTSESTLRYIESLASDIDATTDFLAVGDEAGLDRIKRRNLLDCAQASLAMSLGLSNNKYTASVQFREALGSSAALEDRQQVLLAMLKEKKDEIPSQAVLLMTKPEALDLLAERFPRVRLHGDKVAHDHRERAWYEGSVFRSTGKDKVALTSLLDYVSPPAQ